MKKASYYADLHLHPTLKSSNWGKTESPKNPWETFEHLKPTTNSSRLVNIASKDLAKYSQTNFYKLMEGKVKVAFISLYPTERGFFEIRNVPKFLTSHKAQIEMIALTSGMGPKRIERMFTKTDYYKELHDEYKYLKKHEGASPCGNFTYKIVNNYSELQESLKKENELAIVLTVEGCHALFTEEMLSGKLDKRQLKEKLKENIISIKEWENPPLFMNLMHHFYNQLGGHARSFKIGIGMTLLNQQKALEAGLEGLGIKVLKEMLSENNGKRIHVDTKHMSLKVRKEYYNWIRSYNYLSKSDNIPVICSHGGVNGFKTMSGSLIKPDSDGKNAKSYFFNWAINLSDEEMKIINESKGLMGLIIDKGKLGGGAFLKKANKEKDMKKLKEMYMKLIWDNLFQGVRAIGNKSAWDIFSLGTDYDGAINHVDFYDDATKLPTLYGDLYEYLDRTKYEQSLWHGYKPEELVNKLFSENATDFLERNFK
jgi:microsomal dipeptidase-like Zn-dependent dipeptidase